MTEAGKRPMPSPPHDPTPMPEPGPDIPPEPTPDPMPMVQELPAAALPVKILAPQKGEAVLDLCAAPGGRPSALWRLQIGETISTRRPLTALPPYPK